MDLYINGTGFVSAAGSSADPGFLKEKISFHDNRVQAREPDYTGLIPPMQLRRMSKAVRMGIAAAKDCLDQAGGGKPDALSVGTALGCLYDTEQFLARMVERDEQQLTPTSFIQSTHNTVAGQIALVLGCNGHNLTFVHRGHSFEHALLNASLYLEDNPDHTVLAGGIDELTDTSLVLMQYTGTYREPYVTEDSLYTDIRKGSIAGEGAGFFSVSRKPVASRYLHLKALDLFIARSDHETRKRIERFTADLPVQETDVDLVLLGTNGDSRNQHVYEYVRNERFPSSRKCVFKHLTGEYATAGAVALGFLMQAAATGKWPEQIFGVDPGPADRIVIVNQYLNHYSCWYLERRATA